MRSRPDVVVVELGAGDVTWGLDGVSALAERGLPIVAISPRRDPEWLEATAEAGANAVVTRFDGADDLVAAVASVARTGRTDPTGLERGAGAPARTGEPTLGAREQDAGRCAGYRVDNLPVTEVPFSSETEAATGGDLPYRQAVALLMRRLSGRRAEPVTRSLTPTHATPPEAMSRDARSWYRSAR